MAEPFAVILDRDGVICENLPGHVRSWREFTFLPGVAEALSSLQLAGAQLYLATNQSVVGRGYISIRELEGIHKKMEEVLAGGGVRLRGIAACVHHPQDVCGCRKPATGMLVTLADRHGFRLEEAFVVGDWISDIEAGAAVGAATVLVRTGRGRQAEKLVASGEAPLPDKIADDLIEAAFWILAERGIAVTSGRLDARTRRTRNP